MTQNSVNDFTVDFVGAGLSTSFEVEATIASNFMGSSLTNNAEITGGSDVDGGADATDVDSTPGDNIMDPADPNDNSTGDGDGTSPEDDDFDPAEILLTQVFDLALTKVINATATPPPYAPGSVVQFTIEVFNQGTLDAYDIDVADYVPAGLGPVTLVSGQSGVTQNAVNDFTVDFVGSGLSTTFEVEATIASNFMGSSLTNNAEITGGSDVDGGADVMDADSTPGDNSMDPADPNDNSTGDGDGTSGQDDDFDPAVINLTQVFDLALTKDINTCLLYTSPSPRD